MKLYLRRLKKVVWFSFRKTLFENLKKNVGDNITLLLKIKKNGDLIQSNFSFKIEYNLQRFIWVWIEDAVFNIVEICENAWNIFFYHFSLNTLLTWFCSFFSRISETNSKLRTKYWISANVFPAEHNRMNIATENFLYFLHYNILDLI